MNKTAFGMLLVLTVYKRYHPKETGVVPREQVASSSQSAPIRSVCEYIVTRAEVISISIQTT
jgi:hypothetical protein